MHNSLQETVPIRNYGFKRMQLLKTNSLYFHKLLLVLLARRTIPYETRSAVAALQIMATRSAAEWLQRGWLQQSQILAVWGSAM